MNHDIKQPPVSLPDGCTLLAEACNYVLAERTLCTGKQSYPQYITWRKQYDGSVGLGHYFKEDLQAAKEDFARRSELVNEARLLTLDEMAVVYKALMEYDRSDTIDYDNKELLHHIDNLRSKLEHVPDADTYAKVDVLIVEPEKPPYEAHIFCEPYSFCAEVGGNTAVWYPFKDSAVVLANAAWRESGLPFNRKIGGEALHGNIVIARMNERRCFVSLTEEQKERYTQMFSVMEKDSFQKSVDEAVHAYETTPAKDDDTFER